MGRGGTGTDTLVTLDAAASVVVVATAAAAAVRDCKDVQCGEDTWCESPQLCGEDKPYQCMNGSARFGCSHQRLRWTLKSSDTTCSECCDVTTCEGCRMSKWFLSYLVSNGSSDAVCVERYYEEEADMLANAKYLDKVNSTTFAVQQETMCQDRRHVAYSRFLEQYVPFKGGEKKNNEERTNKQTTGVETVNDIRKKVNISF